jgi:hypothetical protein
LGAKIRKDLEMWRGGCGEEEIWRKGDVEKGRKGDVEKRRFGEGEMWRKGDVEKGLLRQPPKSRLRCLKKASATEGRRL